MTLEKARLIPAPGEKAKTIEFMFNPTKLQFTRSIGIEPTEGSNTNQGNPKTSFKNPRPYTLTISDIILDTYENRARNRSVLTPLKAFTDSVAYVRDAYQKNGTKVRRAPIYVLTWGTNVYLRCFVQNCDFTLTMFLPDGTPVRATLNLTLEQADDHKLQPPQSTPSVSQEERKQQGRVLQNDDDDVMAIFRN